MDVSKLISSNARKVLKRQGVVRSRDLKPEDLELLKYTPPLLEIGNKVIQFHDLKALKAQS
jgi:hypothetical protein